MISLKRFGLLLALCLLALSASPSRAGGGPTGCIVIYDPTDVTSVTIAVRYQNLRNIPDANMIPYVFPVSFTRTTGWDFIYALRRILSERGIDSQLQTIAVAGAVPLSAGQTTPTGNITCLHSFLYMSPNFGQSTYPTSIYRPTNQAFSASADRFLGPSPMGTQTISASTDFNGYRYWPSSALSYPGRNGMSPKEILAFLERSRAQDASKANGVVYWPLNGDIRSATREHQLRDVVEVWSARGIRFAILGNSSTANSWPGNRTDISGAVVGLANFNAFNGNEYLPGAWVDHLTSNGGGFSTFVPSQTSATQWLRAGVAGTSGSISEPYAVDSKFPHGQIHTHLRAGASLSEAFWQSMETPGEVMPLGDPLLQPHADFPSVSIVSPANGATVSGTIHLLANASATNGKVLESALDLFIDGRRVAIGVEGSPIAATRIPGGFSLNTETLGDGWHDVRVVAYNADSVRTQNEAAIGLVVNNGGGSLALTGPATVNPDSIVGFSCTATGFSDLTSLTLQANGRTLGTFPLSGGTVNVDLAAPNTMAPLDGTWTLFAVGVRANGQRVFSAPFTTTVSWPAQAAAVAPSLGAAAANLRYFVDTSAPGFNWDTTSPTAVYALPMAANGIVVTPTTIPGVTITEYAAMKPGFQIDFLFYAPIDDWYELGFDFGAQTNTLSRAAFIDGVPLVERNATFPPRRLAPGWHTIRVRSAFSSAAWASWTLRIRGGFSQDFSTFPGAFVANAGTGVEANTPLISSIGAGSNPVTGATVALTANATIGGGTGSELAGLTYFWSMVSGPRPVTFSANGSNAARTSTATFLASGEYVIGVRVSGPSGSAFLTRPITVSRTGATTLTIDVGPTSSFFRGMSTVMSAVTRDQFGLRIPVTPSNPALPTVQWTSNDGTGSFSPISADGEIVTFRSLAGVSANQSVILTATGVNGRTGNATRTITITPKSLPTSSGGQMFSIGQNAAGSPLLLTASVSDPNVNNIGLTFAWSVISSPAGQNLIISKPSDRSTTATFSGPGLYVVRLQATDAAGQVLTETQTFTIGTDGTVAIPPFVTNPSSLTLDVGTRSGLSVLSKNNGSLQWQSSQDGGATWNDIPGANTGYLSIRPTTLAESGRQYRVVTTNAAGSYTSAPATVTVTSPVGGVITFLSSDAVTLQESVGVLNLTIQRLGSTVGATSTTVSIEDSSAVFGEDFLGFDGSEQVTKTLTWADGDGSDRTITIPIVNDAVVEDAEDFLVSLPVPLGSGEFFGEGVFVSINDDDGPGDPALLNSSPTFFESDGTATFQVHRSGGSKGILTATYVAESGINTATPAVAGQDFTAVSGNLTWADGDTADKTISVPLINDGIFEGDETFRVKVSVPQGFPSSASVTLRDAPYQVWQQETWPWAFTSPVPTYTTFASAIRSLNPLFWFRFSETTGTTTAAIDAAGNPVINGALTIRNASGSVGTVQLNQPGPRPAAFPGFEATNTGLVTTAAGAGTSAPTQYVAGGYVTAGSGNGLASKLGDGFTFSAFVRTNVTDRMMNIIGATATAGTQFSVFVNRSFSSSTTVSPHTLRIYVRDNNNDDLDYSVELAGLPTGSLCDGNWHHIAITVPRFTGTDNADFPRFYFDGVEANPLNVRGVEDLPSSPVFPDFLTFGSGVRIAANGAASIAGFFHGSLDEVAFIPTVLSADGIRLLASAGPTSPLPANLAQGADYDGDGLNNLLEYALGLNPLLPNPTPGYHTTVRVNSQDYLAITYTENLASTDVTKRVEVSSDLTNWASGPAATTEVSSSILGTLRTVTVRDNVPLTAGSRRFIRVKVATP